VREIGIADLWLPAARPSASDGHPGCRGHDEGSLTVGPVFEPLREVAFSPWRPSILNLDRHRGMAQRGGPGS
jgi:hypothetical protein